MSILDSISKEELKLALLNEYKRGYLINIECHLKNLREKVFKKNFSWEVDQDTMEWGYAVEGIRYCKEKI